MTIPRKPPNRCVQAYDDEWIEIGNRTGFREQCCGCGLVHVVDYRIRKGKLQFRARADARGTATAKRAHKRKRK